MMAESKFRLTKEHGYKLTSASKFSGMALSFCFHHSLLELDYASKAAYLRENDLLTAGGRIKQNLALFYF
jgi:hypothetical protein